MRYFQLLLTPTEQEGFHEIDTLTAQHPAIDREAILHLNLLNDGTGVALFLMQGDSEALQEIYRDHESVLSYDIFDSEESGFHAHVHFEPDDPATALLEIVDRHKLYIDPPLEFNEAGALRLTAAGPQELVRQAAIDIPDSVDAHLELIGEYEPQRDSLVTMLTDRQQEVLQTAVEMGYYSIPRQATHEDLASQLDCSAGTVGEHLRKIEACVLSELIP
ncbi:helix-turn-helix domain-containing protein [Halorientalis salina]|uniref:helix-turn-helix domain-containing protein n=1 Tax=Halorientalis salina TaxID=2932266 RepID=UPI0010AD92FF|nr:helix-turn-helix domain-containing protein [Halorientalis salina]